MIFPLKEAAEFVNASLSSSLSASQSSSSSASNDTSSGAMAQGNGASAAEISLAIFVIGLLIFTCRQQINLGGPDEPETQDLEAQQQTNKRSSGFSALANLASKAGDCLKAIKFSNQNTSISTAPLLTSTNANYDLASGKDRGGLQELVAIQDFVPGSTIKAPGKE